jgi:hypothetical protein
VVILLQFLARHKMNFNTIFLALSLIFLSLYEKGNDRYYGSYFGHKAYAAAKLDLYEDGSFKYEVRQGASIREESDGNWRNIDKSIELHSFYQFDSATITTVIDTTITGLNIRIIDFEGMPFNSSIIINGEKLYTVDGEISIPAYYSGNLKLIFSDIYQNDWADTINIDVNKNKQKRITVKHINPLVFAQYRFFKRAIIKHRCKKLIIPQDSNHTKIILTKQ